MVSEMSQIYNSLMRVEKEKQRESNERPPSQIFEREEVKMEQDTVINFPQEKIDMLKFVKGLGEKGFSDEQSSRALSLFFVKLANGMKTNLGVVKTLAELSQGKFKDLEFENNFIKTIKEYIQGAHSGLDCFLDYLEIRSPIRKKNIMHTILEEILNKNEKNFKDRKIQIVKKQFEEDLPETSIPYDHLRYILNWVVQFSTSSISPNGNIGFLTRSFDFQEVRDDSQSSPKRDKKYIEMIIYFMTHETVNEPSGTKLGKQALVRENDFILPLVEEIVRMNRGIMRVKVDPKNQWTQISLILPV
jgi:hypothetical protein